jgi:hypothetical protein
VEWRNFFFIAQAAVFVVGAFAAWSWRVLGVGAFRRHRIERWPLLVFPALGIAGMVWTLRYWADPRVWEPDASYFLWFTCVGLGWMFAASQLCGLFNLILFQDALVGQNRAAIWAGGGAILAASIIYAGGNIGNGDDAMTTFVSAALAAIGWLVSWWMFEWISRISEAISLDRDFAAGIRLAGMLVATSLILGRAVAGNWISFGDTIHDYLHEGWPAFVVVPIAAAFDRFFQPSRMKPARATFTCGVLPALVYLFAAGGWLMKLGKWE